MKNKILNLTLLVFVFTLIFSGCKKGEDDPFFSFRSRNARIAGEWVIRSFTKSVNIQEQSTTMNSVNSERSTTETTTTIDTTISGNKMTVKKSLISKMASTDISFELNDTAYSFITENNITDTEMHSLEEYTLDVDLEIKDDGTYHASITQTLLSALDSTLTLENGTDTLFYDKTDTTYIPQSTSKWTEEGDWHWLDSDKSKIIINAGPMKGNIIRLANDEVIIEDNTTGTENSTDNLVDDFRTFDDVQDPFKMEEGIQTTT